MLPAARVHATERAPCSPEDRLDTFADEGGAPVARPARGHHRPPPPPLSPPRRRAPPARRGPPRVRHGPRPPSHCRICLVSVFAESAGSLCGRVFWSSNSLRRPWSAALRGCTTLAMVSPARACGGACWYCCCCCCTCRLPEGHRSPCRRHAGGEGPGPQRSIPPRHRYLTSRYSSTPYLEPSRPRPDSLTPPALSPGDEPDVDAHDTGLKRLGDPPDPADVAAVEVGGETELGIVGHANCLVLRAEAQQRRHGAEGLLVRHRHVRGHAREDGRLEEGAAELVPPAAANDPSALAQGVGDVLLDFGATAASSISGPCVTPGSRPLPTLS